MPAKGYKRVDGRWVAPQPTSDNEEAMEDTMSVQEAEETKPRKLKTSADNKVVKPTTVVQDMEGVETFKPARSKKMVDSDSDADSEHEDEREPTTKTDKRASAGAALKPSPIKRTSPAKTETTSAARARVVLMDDDDSSSAGRPATPPPKRERTAPEPSSSSSSPMPASSSSNPPQTRAAVVLSSPQRPVASASASASAKPAASAGPEKNVHALVVAETPMPGGRVILDVGGSNQPSKSMLTSPVAGQAKFKAGSFVKLALPSGADTSGRSVAHRKSRPLTDDEIDEFKVGPTSASILHVDDTAGLSSKGFHTVLTYIVSCGDKDTSPGGIGSSSNSAGIPIRTLEVMFKTDDGAEQRMNITLWADKADLVFEPGTVALFDGVFAKKYGGTVVLNATQNVRILCIDTAQAREYKAHFDEVVTKDADW